MIGRYADITLLAARIDGGADNEDLMGTLLFGWREGTEGAVAFTVRRPLADVTEELVENLLAQAHTQGGVLNALTEKYQPAVTLAGPSKLTLVN